MSINMKEIISTGFAIGNNAINEAVKAGTTPELLSTELNQLRYASIYALGSLLFNEEKQIPGSLEDSLEKHVGIIRQVVADLSARFASGELVKGEVLVGE